MPGFIRVGHEWTSDAWWSAVRYGWAGSVSIPESPRGSTPWAGRATAHGARHGQLPALLRPAPPGQARNRLLDSRPGHARARGGQRRRLGPVRHRRAGYPYHRVAPGTRGHPPDAHPSGADFRGHRPRPGGREHGFRCALRPERGTIRHPRCARAHARGAGPLPDVVPRLRLCRPAVCRAGAGRSDARSGIYGSWPLLLLGLASIVCGSLLAPVLNAVVPRIPLGAFGALAGCPARRRCSKARGWFRSWIPGWRQRAGSSSPAPRRCGRCSSSAPCPKTGKPHPRESAHSSLLSASWRLCSSPRPWYSPGSDSGVPVTERLHWADEDHRRPHEHGSRLPRLPRAGPGPVPGIPPGEKPPDPPCRADPVQPLRRLPGHGVRRGARG